MNMASGELGAPAHCKFDIEAWMPNLKFYGEVRSASHLDCIALETRDRYGVH